MKSGSPSTSHPTKQAQIRIPLTYPKKGNAWRSDNKYGYAETEVGVLLYELSKLGSYED